MFLLTLCVAAHHVEEIAAFRALELINRHGAHPPAASHRSVAYKTTLFPSPARGGMVRVGPLFPFPSGGGQGGGRYSPPPLGEGRVGAALAKASTSASTP